MIFDPFLPVKLTPRFILSTPYNICALFLFFLSGCPGSSLLWVGFLWQQRVEATLGCGEQASHCGGFSCCAAQGPGSRLRGFQKLRHTSSVVADRGLRCSTACGVAPEQASNPHWQVDSQSTVPPGKSMSAVLASCVVSKCVNRSKFNKIPSQWVLQSSLLYLQCLIQLAHQYYESF